jgi:hypothetical protein
MTEVFDFELLKELAYVREYISKIFHMPLNASGRVVDLLEAGKAMHRLKPIFRVSLSLRDLLVDHYG